MRRLRRTTRSRLQQEPLQDALGTEVTVSYKPGGGGALAWSELTRTEADGYTIMGHNLPHIILQPMMREDAGYETGQLKQVYIFQSTPNILAVPADSDIKTLDDFIAAAKENPAASRSAAAATSAPTTSARSCSSRCGSHRLRRWRPRSCRARR
ncbi:tripartite tricarboxylate transporter substrate-binding protein [Georgenia sp. SUBG003]|uniref:tripartite tricarboxylate transporter substrate-binding protein n=1 Tax=Georgenia sp. SUBG003 TaxID=1497974 RepID=UPI003AB2526E